MGNSQRLMILCHLLEGEKLTGAWCSVCRQLQVAEWAMT